MGDNEIDTYPPILEELKPCLRALLGDRLVRLVLFGSRARGDYRSDSDMDVAMVVRDLAPALKKGILDLIAELELKHDTPLSVLVLSEDQFNHLKQRERRIALDIEREGIPL